MPKRYETGDADYEYPKSTKDLYHQQYVEVLDLAINCIQDRTHFCVVEDPTAADDIQHVMDVYKGDINKFVSVSCLKAHSENSGLSQSMAVNCGLKVGIKVGEIEVLTRNDTVGCTM
ncbi:hypothetical protein MAR_023832 [Mya arenaria]|uniref:Uncharacterized protein n=1 Tax=Mya arenaria TaxID=6604 RepID=A0ABY7DPX9_MYAAR|nr:hypothetical protein MAR_023832 [Mya arenaria]